MTGLNRTSNTLWRGPAAAEVEPKRVALSPERWMLLTRHLEGFALTSNLDMAKQPVQATLVAPVEIDGVTFLPAVYFPA